MKPDQPRQKIAILGGGVSAITAAFELTDQPGWEKKYDVTIYQLGWRLGGKCASGRNSQANDRIEEHGLHVWGGFYENSFSVMRRCYAHLGRSPDAPLATWRDAFKPQNFVALEENVNGEWKRWVQMLAANEQLPGEGHELLPLWDYVRMAVDWMLSAFNRSPHAADAETTSRPRELPAWLEREVQRVMDLLVPETVKGASPEGVAEPTIVSRLEHTFLHLAHWMLSSHDSNPQTHSAASHHGILWLLDEFLGWFYRHIEKDIATNDVTRRLWILVNFTYAAVRGVLADGVLYKGFRSIDDLDFAEWLRKHGATELTLQSALVRGYYDYFFAYKQGDPDQPSLAAGAGLAHLLRLTMTYKTAIFWEMQAGMGDTVFAPLYLVLKKRGVKFSFFHVVENLGLSADKKSISTIRIGRQVNLKSGTYDPLVNVKDLPCWPSNPLFNQITEGEELRGRGINLESPWSPWKNVAEITLLAGVDFDKVILGITLAALKPICTELVAASDAWKKMFDNVQTVQTAAAQVWFRPDAAHLGWTQPPPVLTSYAHPLDSAADFTHLLGRENWPAIDPPRTLWYFCGALEDVPKIPGYADHAFPTQQEERVKDVAIQWLQDNGARLWPAASPPNNPTGLDWNVLNDPKGRAGAARFDAQYWRANVNPAERYVLTLPGDSRFRLSTEGSGFQNLYLTGDWVYTGLGGCVEGAVIAGMMASRAVAGYPQRIIGETDVWMAESLG